MGAVGEVTVIVNLNSRWRADSRSGFVGWGGLGPGARIYRTPQVTPSFRSALALQPQPGTAPTSLFQANPQVALNVQSHPQDSLRGVFRVAGLHSLQAPMLTIPLQHPIDPLPPKLHYCTRRAQPDAHGHGQSRHRFAGPLREPEPQSSATRTQQEKHSPKQHRTPSNGIPNRWSRKITGNAAHGQRHGGT